jgi:hypothetical protein
MADEMDLVQIKGQSMLSEAGSTSATGSANGPLLLFWMKGRLVFTESSITHLYLFSILSFRLKKKAS